MAKASTAVADLAQDLAHRLAQDLGQVEVEPAPRIRLPRELGRPTVVVDDVHITYRIVGAGGKGGAKIGLPTPAAAVRRLVTRKSSSVKVREIKAVKGVSFVARQGEAIGLLGSNGSGKSTLLRAIAGLLPVNGGAVYTMGQPSLLGANAALLTELSHSPPLIRQIDRASALPFASPSGFVMAQSVLPEAHQILIIAQDHHRIVVDAIENREGARAEAVMREHARLAARNLRLALRNRTHLDLLPALALIRSPVSE